MKYGILGGFIRLAFAKTAFAYMEEAVPELDMDSYQKRVLKEYRAIVERTPGIGSVMDYYTFEMQGAVLDRTKTLGWGDDECSFHLMSRARAEELGFTPGPDAK